MKSIYVVDASGVLYRSYFAMTNMTNGKGESTNSLFGFVRAFFKLVKDFHPTHVVSVFDGPNNAKARLAIYPEYKAHRLEMPVDLRHQIAWAQEFCEMYGIPSLTIPGVEADDTMGTLAAWGKSHGAEVFLCTGDKDMCQLVNSHVKIIHTHKENAIIGEKEVEAQFGVPPSQIVDFLAITGDASDNIPGLSGFGPKTAADLLKKFGTLEYILDHPLEVSGAKKQQTIVAERQNALISKQLVTIDMHVPVPDDIEFYRLKKPKIDQVRHFFTDMNFRSFAKELESITVEDQKEAPVHKPIETRYHTVHTRDELENLVQRLMKEKEISIDTETTSVRAMEAELVGVGLCVKPGEAWYIPLNGLIVPSQVISALKPLLDNKEIGFYGHNIKYDLHVLKNHGLNIANVCFDTIVASYILNSHQRQHSLDQLTLEYFDKVKIPISDLIGKGKTQITMKNVSIPLVTDYCCEDVDYTCRLKSALQDQLKTRGLETIFYTLELPLLQVLFEMEENGIYLDIDTLHKNGKIVADQIGKIQNAIYEQSGEVFNLNSTESLARVLIEKFGVKLTKKTPKTGKFALDADVLDAVRDQHPIVETLLNYRTLEKLRSTYFDSLEKEINPRTHRIHTTYNQFIAATGRLSSTEPNLQNIPVRTEEGRNIREAFRPEKQGWSFLGADYSQIELRLLAHLSQDAQLVQAFLHGEDIHAHTAAAIYHIPLSQVTKEQRQYAKVVNFGVIYGQQAFGLARELKISNKEAQAFIEMYFKLYSRVKEYLEECKERSRQTGKAVTFTGRERLIPEINNTNKMIRSAAERLAINTPLQGSSADLIKKAMLDMNRILKEQKLQSMLILQVHDELVFEVPDNELPLMKSLVKQTMESVMELKVPLVVDIAIGKNWKEC